MKTLPVAAAILVLVVVLAGGIAAAFRFATAPRGPSTSFVPGPPAALTVEMTPAEASCAPETLNLFWVTAHVHDSLGQPVADGTKVRFYVPALGVPNPVDAVTQSGDATTTVTVMSRIEQLVPVYVSSGDLEHAIAFFCKNPADPASPPPTPISPPPSPPSS